MRSLPDGAAIGQIADTRILGGRSDLRVLNQEETHRTRRFSGVRVARSMIVRVPDAEILEEQGLRYTKTLAAEIAGSGELGSCEVKQPAAPP